MTFIPAGKAPFREGMPEHIMPVPPIGLNPAQNDSKLAA
jgi:hypothetical protein